MNARERFLAVMAFRPEVRTLLWEWGYWAGTVERWYGEGLPKGRGLSRPAAFGDSVAGPGAAWRSGVANIQTAEDVSIRLGFDPPRETIPLQNLLWPPFEIEIIEEDEENLVLRDETGMVSRQRKDRGATPHYIDWPVKGLVDWERIKEERLQPDVASRLPADWPRLVGEYRHRDYPLAIGSGYCGFFGVLRALLGEERLFCAYYDDPALVHRILDDLCDFWIEIYGEVLQQVQPDSAEFWEDMAYRNGPLVSPAIFREFMMPRYRRLIGFMRERGVRHFCVDTDGNCWQLIPLFLECGMTGMLPFEVQAGMDIVEVRKRYPGLQIYGGLDKRALALGRQAIDLELAKARQLLRQGGYIPMVDHLVPPDVPWENYTYFRSQLLEIAEQCAFEAGMKGESG